MFDDCEGKRRRGKGNNQLDVENIRVKVPPEEGLTPQKPP